MEYFLVELLVTLNICILKSNLLVREQHEVVNQYLGCLFKCILRVNGTIRRDFEDEFVVVGLLLDTIWLYREFHVANRSVNRIDWYYINIGAELTVLICRYVSATFVDSKINLH